MIDYGRCFYGVNTSVKKMESSSFNEHRYQPAPSCTVPRYGGTQLWICIRTEVTYGICCLFKYMLNVL